MNQEEKKSTILPDEEIVELYWNREEKAIEATDKKYGKYVYTIAYNIVKNSQDCEECVNDTYLGVWNRIPPSRPTVFQVFLAKIARNIAVDCWRKNTSEKRVSSEMTVSLEEISQCMSTDLSVEEQVMIREITKILNDYLKSLGDRDVFLFISRYYYADPIKKIADMLKLSERTVYRDLERMRDELGKRLEEGGYSRG